MINPPVRVIHYRDRDRLEPAEQLIYIARANSRYKLSASPLGNPYRVKPYGPYSRDESMQKYAEWLPHDAAAQAELARLTELLTQGQHLVLACWCKPKSCHGDIIAAELIDKVR